MASHLLLVTRRLVKILVVCVLVLPVLVVSFLKEVTAQDSPQFSCETPTTVSDEVRAAFEAHFQCTEKVYDAWFSRFPIEMAQLHNLYLAWQSSRLHDLRGQAAAEQWVKQYPVNFSAHSVELSKNEVRAVGPTQSGEPVQIKGVFKGFSVGGPGFSPATSADFAGNLSG